MGNVRGLKFLLSNDVANEYFDDILWHSQSQEIYLKNVMMTHHYSHLSNSSYDSSLLLPSFDSFS